MNGKWLWITSIGLAVVSAPLVGVYADEKEENEQETTLDQIPKPARDTLVKEAAGGKIMKVESEKENGKTTYEAHVQPAQGAEFAVKVDPAGKLLSKGPESD
jgi:uncharacterized membrane protein YkoI